MFKTPSQIAPARLHEILKVAEKSARAIPPAFPLDATVAVNPFLGQSGEDLATASARLGRVAGIRLTRPGAEYVAAIRAGEISDADLADALAASTATNKPADVAALKVMVEKDGEEVSPLPTIADLAAEKTVGLWAAGQFDRGQALWSPAPGAEAFAAWRAWAANDLTPEIAGLKGFCAHVSNAPDTAERVILRVSDALGIDVAAASDGPGRLVSARPLAAVAGRTCGAKRSDPRGSSGDPADLGRSTAGACAGGQERVA